MPPSSKKSPDMEIEKLENKPDPEVLLQDALANPLSTFCLPETREQECAEPVSPLHKTDSRSSIGYVIRMVRKERGISQEELARKARIDRTTIARIECGIFKALSVERLEGIALALGLDLKTLLFKAESMEEVKTCRGDLTRIEFVLDYPEEGFRIVSLIPKRREFFFGKIEIKPQKTIISGKLPHPEQIYLHIIEGKMLLVLESKEYLFKPGDCFAFSGMRDYELYNPEQLKITTSLFITYPSFLSA